MDSGISAPKPRVLAITAETFAIRQLRLEMPLCNLKRRGLIEDYLITDLFFQNLPDDYSFDTVWVQRMVNEKVGGVLADRINNNYLYDLDDLLIGWPTYTMMCLDRNCKWKEAVRAALSDCKALACSTQRLVTMLEAGSGLSLSPKAVICPNGFEFSKTLRRPEQPAGMVWTSSDLPALLQSREPVLKAVCKFSEKYDLPIYGFGHFEDPIVKRIRNFVELGPIPFFHHKTLLASLPTLIGIAPLETSAGQANLDFINSKSDLKMVEFGGFGHPAVYSDAPPYTDTDLQCGVVAPNDEASWFDAMELILREKWNGLDTEQARVVEARNMDRMAGEHWYEVIRRVQMDRPLIGADIKNGFKRTRKTRAACRPTAELVRPCRNVFDWDAYDNVYHFWKEYRKKRIARFEALKIIDDGYGLPLFLALYPLYKIVKPLRKLMRLLNEHIV